MISPFGLANPGDAEQSKSGTSLQSGHWTAASDEGGEVLSCGGHPDSGFLLFPKGFAKATTVVGYLGSNDLVKEPFSADLRPDSENASVRSFMFLSQNENGSGQTDFEIKIVRHSEPQPVYETGPTYEWSLDSSYFLYAPVICNLREAEVADFQLASIVEAEIALRQLQEKVRTATSDQEWKELSKEYDEMNRSLLGMQKSFRELSR